MARDYPGDDIFDALVTLGYDITVGAGGDISAIRNQALVRGTVNEDGSITWHQGAQGLVRLARVKELQQRAMQAENMRPS